MIDFKISAPSKLSLFGEYAVKYGKKGLTAGINLRTTLTFTELPHLSSEGIIQIDFLQIDLLLSIPLQQFLDFYQSCTFNENNNELHDQVLQFITSNHCPFRTEYQRAIAQSFVYLLAYIAHKEKIDIKSFYMHLSTQLAIDESFVCLASSTVCLAACLLHWSSLQKGAIDDFDSSDLNKIHSYAVRCENISREFGTVDVAVCTYGSIIQHQIGEALRHIPFFEMLNVKILLVDSKQTQDLGAQTQRIAELVNRYPEITHSIFKNIDFATSTAACAFQSLCDIYINELGLETKRLTLMMQYNILLIFMHLNQRLLHLLDVSHFHLDKICSVAISHELYAKYTDIGNGRCAYIWCLPNTPTSRISRLCAELKANNFDITETTLACSGVKIEY